MEEASLIPKLTGIFHDVFDDDTIVLRDDTTARDVAGWDSVANIRLMVSIEEAFGFQFDTAEISEMRNVGDLIAAIRSRTK
jgi:acyl carrier protein